MFRLLVAAALIASLAACDSHAEPSGAPAINTVLPDETVPAPGSCDPATEELPPPKVSADGTSTDMTVGRSSNGCSGLTGEGYLVYSYNPVLIDDAEDPVTVEIGSDATATLTWSDGEPFTETTPGTWKSSEPTKGCARLVVELVSASGESKATYGADIRVGGTSVECPQRVIDPSDPTDTT